MPKLGATLNCNISSWKQAFDKLSKARIYYYTWTYEVCQNKQQEEGQKVRKKCQNHSKFNFVYLWFPEND